jgi:hypothetical protein
MWWKIYFVIITLICLLLLKDYLSNLNWNLSDFAGFLSLFPFVIGIFAFAFKKKIFTVRFWKLYFWYEIVSTVGYLLYDFTPLKDSQLLAAFFKSNIYPDTEVSENKLVCIFCLSLMFSLIVPSIYILYRLGYPKQIKSNKS